MVVTLMGWNSRHRSYEEDTDPLGHRLEFTSKYTHVRMPGYAPDLYALNVDKNKRF